MCFLLMVPLSDADRAGCYAFSFIGCLCSVSTLPSFDADRVGHIAHSQEVRALFWISLRFILIISCIPCLQLVSAWFQCSLHLTQTESDALLSHSLCVFCFNAHST
jgi:hypothetical protein